MSLLGVKLGSEIFLVGIQPCGVSKLSQRNALVIQRYGSTYLTTNRKKFLNIQLGLNAITNFAQYGSHSNTTREVTSDRTYVQGAQCMVDRAEGKVNNLFLFLTHSK